MKAASARCDLVTRTMYSFLLFFIVCFLHSALHPPNAAPAPQPLPARCLSSATPYSTLVRSLRSAGMCVSCLRTVIKLEKSTIRQSRDWGLQRSASGSGLEECRMLQRSTQCSQSCVQPAGCPSALVYILWQWLSTATTASAGRWGEARTRESPS